MRIPGKAHQLVGSVVLADSEVLTTVLQAHVIKHPFGMGAILGGTADEQRRRWDSEGWDAVDPCVIAQPDRRRCVEQIRGLEVADGRCRVQRLHREEYGGESSSDEPCYECGRALAGACADITGAVAARYAGWVDAVLSRVASDAGVRVSPLDLQTRVLGLVRSPTRLDGLVVASLGCDVNDDRISPRLRFNAWNGIRVEFRQVGPTWRWRTTYRRPPEGAPRLAGWLLDPAPGGALLSSPMSGDWWVPRPWWQETEPDGPS